MKKQGQKRPLAVLVTLSLLVAISIICGKYLAIRGGDVLRFSFENLPILLAGILFGPLAGAAVGVVADLVGCLLVGYPINPIVTLGAALIGLSSGLLWRVFVRLETLSVVFQLPLTVCISHFVGSVVVKTFGLAAFYSFPIEVLFLWRLLNYAIIGAVESILLCLLFRNQFFRKQILHSSSVKGGYENGL